MKFNHTMLEVLVRGLDKTATVKAVATNGTVSKELTVWSKGNTISANKLKRFTDGLTKTLKTFFVIKDVEESFMIPATSFGLTI